MIAIIAARKIISRKLLMRPRLRSSLRHIAVVGLIFSVAAISTRSQGRISDKDLANLMSNLKDDSKSFKSPFTKALKKSAIRKTSQQKKGESLASSFEKQTQAIHDYFKKTKQVDMELTAVRSTAAQIDGMVSTLNLGPQVVSRWEKIESELQQISAAFGVQSSRTRYARDAQSHGADPNAPPPCDRAVGAEQAQRLVQECLAVSAATHPPCNVQNSCPLIIDEIKRGCASIQPRNVPAFCNEYR
jgi:hypothetical protein